MIVSALTVSVLGADRFGSHHEAVLLDLLDPAGDKEVADLSLLGSLLRLRPRTWSLSCVSFAGLCCRLVRSAEVKPTRNSSTPPTC